MKKGFTLLELITVVMIVAILAIIAVPQFFRVAERARASEGVNVLGIIRSAQMRYYGEHSANYSASAVRLDVDLPASYRHFSAPAVGAVNATITRSGAGVSIGNYTLTINYDSGTITCAGGAANTCTKLNL